MVIKIISGGQTGGDIGGLLAGAELGLQTGGTAPKGFRTDSGLNPELANYGLVEHTSSSYRPRTIENVRNSDGTVLFGNVSSPGCKLTILTCIKLQKPYMTNPSKLELIGWIDKKFIKILNVAGNRESSYTGLQEKVKNFLTNVLTSKEYIEIFHLNKNKEK